MDYQALMIKPRNRVLTIFLAVVGPALLSPEVFAANLAARVGGGHKVGALSVMPPAIVQLANTLSLRLDGNFPGNSITAAPSAVPRIQSLLRKKGVEPRIQLPQENPQASRIVVEIQDMTTEVGAAIEKAGDISQGDGSSARDMGDKIQRIISHEEVIPSAGVEPDASAASGPDMIGVSPYADGYTALMVYRKDGIVEGNPSESQTAVPTAQAAKTDRQRALELHGTISRMIWKMIRLQFAVESAPENAGNLQEIAQNLQALLPQVSPMGEEFLKEFLVGVPISSEEEEHYMKLSNALENVPLDNLHLPQIKTAYDQFFNMKQELVGRVENFKPETSNKLKQAEWVLPAFTVAVNQLYAKAVASGLLPEDEDAKPLPEGQPSTPLSKDDQRHLHQAMASTNRSLETILSLMPRAYEILGDATRTMSSDLSNSQADGMIGRFSQAISNALEQLAGSPEFPFLKAYSDAGRDFEVICARLSEAVLSTVPPGQRMEVMTGLVGAMQQWMMAHIFSLDIIEMVSVLTRKSMECLSSLSDLAQSMPQETRSSLPSLAQDAAKLEAALKRLPQAGTK